MLLRSSSRDFPAGRRRGRNRDGGDFHFGDGDVVPSNERKSAYCAGRTGSRSILRVTNAATHGITFGVALFWQILDENSRMSRGCYRTPRGNTLVTRRDKQLPFLFCNRSNHAIRTTVAFPSDGSELHNFHHSAVHDYAPLFTTH